MRKHLATSTQPTLDDVLGLMTESLAMLDQLGVSAEIGALLDLAISRLQEVMAREGNIGRQSRH